MSELKGFEFKKEENKLTMSILMFIVFLVTTLILYVLGILGWSSIYVSEVLIWTKVVLENYQENTFSDVFINLLKNILKHEWSRKYLVMYWTFMTGFLIFIVIGYFLSKRKMSKSKF